MKNLGQIKLLSESYLTFDDPALLASARLHPSELVAEHAQTAVAIDECQLAPELKEWVRTHKKTQWRCSSRIHLVKGLAFNIRP